jgi:transcriptional regulator with XRE-family HTH domain
VYAQNASTTRARGRSGRGLTAESPAKAEHAVARIERDDIDPRMNTLRKLAQALEVDPAELVGD